ncbi:MAG: cyclic nucleotide-binding domain-containing protein [Planctomyces sp.]|nr:cyclic nucleotide-binding domain-containing protein [Planctomyces sp.]
MANRMTSGTNSRTGVISAEKLTAYPTFEGLGPADAARVIQDMTRMNFDADSTILHEGKSIQALWIILSGECTVVRQAEDGSEMVLAELRVGDVFGEMSFVRTAPHSATIRAKTSVSVCTYTREDFMKLAAEHPGAAFRICSNIAAVLSERLQRMDAWICQLVDRPEAVSHRDEWQTFRSAVYSNWNF